MAKEGELPVVAIVPTLQDFRSAAGQGDDEVVLRSAQGARSSS